jgi:acetyltransferase-like isoleucine patch superfamily enzyme
MTNKGESEVTKSGDVSEAQRASDDFLVRRRLRDGATKARYQELVIGRPGFLSLVLYETVVTLTSWVPGALGLVLRRYLYPLLLGDVGRKPVFGRNVVLRHPHKIFLGDRVIIDDNCLLDAKGAHNQGIRIGNDVFLGRNSILSCKDGDIHLEDGVNIGFNSYVFSGSTVKVGRDSLFAAYCYVIGGGHDFEDPEAPVQEQVAVSHGVEIGSNVWLGAGVKVLDGVTVGSNTVVGAGAVVNGDLPDRCIAAGLPAKVLRER